MLPLADERLTTMIYAKTLGDLNAPKPPKLDVVASTTPAGGGDITPAPVVSAPSLASCSTAEDSGVVEPPKPVQTQAEAGSDEIELEELFDFDLIEPEPDETTRFGIDTTGILTIATPFDGSLELPAKQVSELYEFLMNTSTIWRPACKRS